MNLENWRYSSSQPEKENFMRLEKDEVKLKKVLIKPDHTMNNLIKLIENAHKQNNISMPKEYILHIENLCNLREPKLKLAEKAVNEIEKSDNYEIKNLLYKSRFLTVADRKNYHFCFFTWGKTGINKKRQEELLLIFPDVFQINKTLNNKGYKVNVKYPVHLGRVNRDFNRDNSIFFEAIAGKIKSYM